MGEGHPIELRREAGRGEGGGEFGRDLDGALVVVSFDGYVHLVADGNPGLDILAGSPGTASPPLAKRYSHPPAGTRRARPHPDTRDALNAAYAFT